MVECGNGNKIFWPHGLPNGISLSLDSKISSPNPESWREGILGKNYSESDARPAWMRGDSTKYPEGPHTHGNSDSAKVCGQPGVAKDQRNHGVYVAQEV